jgi:hypothetical protein
MQMKIFWKSCGILWRTVHVGSDPGRQALIKKAVYIRRRIFLVIIIRMVETRPLSGSIATRPVSGSLDMSFDATRGCQSIETIRRNIEKFSKRGYDRPWVMLRETPEGNTVKVADNAGGADEKNAFTEVSPPKRRIAMNYKAKKD